MTPPRFELGRSPYLKARHSIKHDREANMDTWYDVISYFESDDFKEEAKEKIAEMEVNEDRILSSSERDTIFQSIVSMSSSKSSSKSRYVLGRGYMAKLPTSTERVRNELNSEVQSMKSQLDAKRVERVAKRAEMEAKFEVECAARVAEHAEMEVQFQRLRQTMREEFQAILANQS